MAIPLFEENMDIISGLGDYPQTDDGLTTEEFKSIFDEAGKKIKRYLNEQLIPNLNLSIDADELSKYILSKALNVEGDVMHGNIDMNGNRIMYLPDPNGESEPTTRRYVDTTFYSLNYNYKTITLSVSNWSNKQQSVSVSGVTNNVDLTVSPTPTRENVNAYNDAEVICVSSDSNTITFQCESVPTTNLSVNIKYRNLGVNA